MAIKCYKFQLFEGASHTPSSRPVGGDDIYSNMDDFHRDVHRKADMITIHSATAGKFMGKTPPPTVMGK